MEKENSTLYDLSSTLNEADDIKTPLLFPTTPGIQHESTKSVIETQFPQGSPKSPTVKNNKFAQLESLVSEIDKSFANETPIKEAKKNLMSNIEEKYSQMMEKKGTKLNMISISRPITPKVQLGVKRLSRRTPKLRSSQESLMNNSESGKEIVELVERDSQDDENRRRTLELKQPTPKKTKQWDPSSDVDLSDWAHLPDDKVWVKKENIYYPGKIIKRTSRTRELYLVKVYKEEVQVGIQNIFKFQIKLGDVFLLEDSWKPVEIVEIINSEKFKVKPLKGRALKVIKLKKLALDESLLESNQNPVPEVKSDTTEDLEIGTPKIFAGLSFICTGIGECRKQRSVYYESDDGIEFEKSHVLSLLKEAGGDICRWTEIEEKYKKYGCRLLLVANEPRRTVKYLAALGLGIPRVSSKWIADCLENAFVFQYDSYVLSNGFSKVINSFVGSFQKLGERKLLEETSAFVNGSLNFRRNWSSLLKLCGCTLTDSVKEGSIPEFILSESKLTKKLQGLATQHEIPVVNTEWAVQSLIHQTVLDFDDSLYSL